MGVRADRRKGSHEVSAWVRQNLWHVITTVALAFVLVGQYQERADGAARSLVEHSARLTKLEELASQERARLDGVYLRRDLSDEQLRAIAMALAAVDKRLERIEGRLR